MDLPVALGDAFTLEHARAQERTGAFRSGFDIPSSGIRVRRGVELTLPEQLGLLRAVLPPDIAFSHDTAAELWGLPLPARGAAPDLPVHVIRPIHRPPVVRRGVVSHKGIGTRDIAEVEGLPVTTVVDTWCDLAASWSRAALVAAGDVLVREHGDEHLRELVSDLRGCRGVRTMRELLPLLRARSASPTESRARLVFHDAGLPEPELNVEIVDDVGVWLATPDFTWRAQKVVGEYDGDQHRTDRTAWQYERDRRARLEDHGWTYVEMTYIHLVDPARREQLVRRLAAHLL